MILAGSARILVHAPQVAFRAARDYVHSTTLYEEILSGARINRLVPDGPIMLRMRRLLTYQPEIRYSQHEESLATEAPIIFSLHVAGIEWHGTVIARTEPVQHRMPYDETSVRAEAIFERQSVRVGADTGGQPIEIVTALTLLLHQHLFKIPTDRKWFLSRLDLERPLVPEDGRGIGIALNQKLGHKMTRSSITAFDAPIGRIEFALGDVIAFPSTCRHDLKQR